MLLTPKNPVGVAVWSEFIPYATVESYLPLMKRHDVSLYLAVNDASLENEDFYRLWAETRKKGIEIRPWLLLSEAEGYWANKWNAPQIEALVERFLSRLAARGLETGWITLDLEPPPDFNRELTEALGARKFLEAWRTLGRYSKSGSYFGAQKAYADLVRRLQSRGIRVHAVTNPFVLHDYRVEGHRIQSALGVPIRDIPWDEVSFMVYRPEFIKLMGKVSEDVVYLYSKSAKHHLGARAAIDLGEVGLVTFPDVTQGYTDAGELRKDYAAARAAGVENLHVYSFDGLLPRFAHEPEKLDDWFGLPAARKPRKDYVARFYLGVMDRVASWLPKP